MPQHDNNLYAFGEFRLDPAERALFRGNELVSLTPKALETLLALVRRAGHVVNKEELMQEVWPDTFVEEGNLNVNISALRKVLAEAGNGQVFIETIPRRGYRFVASVSLLPADRGELLIEKITRARIVTEVEDDSGAALSSPSASPALEVPWQGEERRHTTGLIPGEPAAALPVPKAGLFLQWLLLAGTLAAAVALFAGGRWYLNARPGSPVRVSLADKKLIAWDAKDRVSWEYDFPQPAEFQVVQGQPYALFNDLLGDGRREFLALVNLRAENPAVDEVGGDRPTGYNHSFLYCFSEKGRLLWNYSPDLKLSFAGHTFEGPWPATAMTLTPAAKGQTIWVAYRHHTWWPSFVVRIDARGASSLAFVNSGTLSALASVRNASGNYVLAAGTNNSLGSAILAVLGVDEQMSASPQFRGDTYVYDNWARAPHLYIVFPPSEVFRLGGDAFHLIASLVVQADRVEVQTNEGRDPSGYSGRLLGYYEFTKDFQLASATLGDVCWHVHRLYESQSKTHHSAERCPDRAIGSRVREYTSAGGWLTMYPPSERPAN